jgi:P2 family phage contractile tail tube protein
MAFQPQRIVNYRAYLGKNNQFDLGLATVALPTFQSLVETISGAGIAGEMESVVIGHFASMSVVFNFRAPNATMFAAMQQTVQVFDVRGSVQQADSTSGAASTVQEAIEIRGLVKRVALGTLEAGKVQSVELEAEVHRIAISLGGVERLLLDKDNFIYRVNGVDRLASVRADMGV